MRALFHDLREQRFLAAELVVERGKRAAGATHDLVHARTCVALAQEQPLALFDDAFAACRQSIRSASTHSRALALSPASGESPASLRLRRARLTSTKNIGTKIVATNVDISMPPNTPVPIDWRAADPAPVEIASGATPSMKASDVITIGRKRKRAASTAASIALLPDR